MTGAPDISVVVNGRFRQQPLTGVQRYATEITRRLPDLLPDVVVAEPPRGQHLGRRGQARAATGAVWEQVVLPATAARRAPSVLLSLCNWGPVAVRRQVLTVHDLAPLVVPDAFPRGYVQRFRTLGLATAARAERLVTVSNRSADALAAHLGVNRDTVAVVAPGVVGPPVGRARRAPGHARPFALLVGAHDPRKNARSALRWWPEVHRRTGVRLVLTARSATLFGTGADTQVPSWCTIVTDPDDDDLWRLYARASLLVAPSRYEGFGLPLLEALSCGTPFLSSDVGAAGDLAVEDWWIVPEHDAAWVARTERLVAAAGPDLEHACRQRAAPYTWERAARAYAALLTGPASGDGAHVGPGNAAVPVSTPTA